MPPDMGTRLSKWGRSRGLQPSREMRFRDMYDQDIARTGEIGGRLMDDFAGDITSFNPSDAFQRRLNAAQSQFKRDWGRGVRDLRGSQVGRGRLNTGFGYQDEDRLFEALGTRFAETSGAASLQAAGLDLQALGLKGNFADRLSDRAMGARGGEYQTLRQQRFTDAAEKRRGRGDLIGGLLAAGGTILAGPLGGAIGGWAGNKFGGR